MVEVISYHKFYNFLYQNKVSCLCCRNVIQAPRESTSLRVRWIVSTNHILRNTQSGPIFYSKSFLRSNGGPQPAYSYYPDDEFQHFYRWTSPPGILKIMSIIVIVLCVAIFACVASTLAWDTQGGLSGFGGLGYGGAGYGAGGYGGGGYAGGGYSSFGGGAYGAGNSYGYGGLGGNYNDPRSGKGFIIAMAAITFIVALVIFIIIVSHQSISQSRKFYLAVIIICAILALLMLIASIVYLIAVNPMAQSQGSVYGNQIAGLCAQYQQPQPSGVFVNQYLYHYCVVEPQEVCAHTHTHTTPLPHFNVQRGTNSLDVCGFVFQAIAVVFGFVVAIALIIMLVFAVKTRQKINNYGKSNILWRKVKVIDEMEPPQDVEAWVCGSCSRSHSSASRRNKRNVCVALR